MGQRSCSSGCSPRANHSSAPEKVWIKSLGQKLELWLAPSASGSSQARLGLTSNHSWKHGLYPSGLINDRAWALAQVGSSPQGDNARAGHSANGSIITGR